MENRIRRLRKMQGLTLAELGARTGLSIGSLNHYELGRHEPKLKTWKKLADYFNVSVPYLQGLTNIDVIQNDRSYSKEEAIEYIKKAMKALEVTQDDLL